MSKILKLTERERAVAELVHCIVLRDRVDALGRGVGLVLTDRDKVQLLRVMEAHMDWILESHGIEEENE